ncbi:uncharacterized protein LOC119828689 [Zerene cesonia]|uniref:uncharacterized protein LOC119828689 n=1 Tax=Zerene cesonia TaxID=33412 RepID=UPI0018E504A0|nr:uncharacterized protein LOC119828689 [Zerene cesonia]
MELIEPRGWTLNLNHFILNNDKDPVFIHYVKLLLEVEYTDGSYYTYYGDIKKIVNIFLIHWSDIMNQAIIEADRLSHNATKHELLEIIERTIKFHQAQQVDFGKHFLPIETPTEKNIYEEIEKIYHRFMGELYITREIIKKLDTPEKVDNFAKEHFPISLKHKNSLFAFTYEYITLLLAMNINKIRVSLEEIHKRMQSNLFSIQEECNASLSSLLHQLYDKNKEHLTIFRQDIRSSFDIAEVIILISSFISIIKDKIEDSKHVPTERLKEEVNYWRERVHEFNIIYKTMMKLKEEKDVLTVDEKMFLEVLENPEKEYESTLVLDDSAKQKVERLHILKLNAAKALFTFFTLKGPDRKFYKDRIGTYYIDEYGHQVYMYNFGLNIYHVDCKGEFFQKHENDLYFYDTFGRYVIKDGEQLYQIAPCSSLYKLDSDVRVKVTQDCGHSERVNKDCKMQIKDPFDVEMLPPCKPVDTKSKNTSRSCNWKHTLLLGKLDTETVNYLWENFGHILPDALLDVAKAQPKKPIHYLAHKILYHKYRRTPADIQKEKQSAYEYREAIYRKRKEEAVKLSKKWKEQQVKHRKPEESDDAGQWFHYNSYVAKQEFIRYLENYNV